MKYTNKEKIDLIKCESLRIWEYLKEAIECIENKYYNIDFYDTNELLMYCKSCAESYDTVEQLTNELEHDLESVENE